MLIIQKHTAHLTKIIATNAMRIKAKKYGGFGGFGGFGGYGGVGGGMGWKVSMGNMLVDRFRYCFGDGVGVGGNTVTDKALAQANQAYSKYGWSSQFVDHSLKSFQKQQQLQNYETLLQLITFHLQKTLQNEPKTHPEHLMRLWQGIYYACYTGDHQRAQQWLNTLYDILKEDPIVGEKIMEGYGGQGGQGGSGSYLDFEIAQILYRFGWKGEAVRWLELFLGRFEGGNEGKGKVGNQAKLYCYLQLTQYYEIQKRSKEALECSQKAYSIVQNDHKNTIKLDAKQATIYNYALSSLYQNQPETSTQIYNTLAQTLDWSNPSSLQILLKTSSKYALPIDFAHKNAELLDKLEEVCRQKRGLGQFDDLWARSVLGRFMTRLRLRDFGKLEQVVREILGQLESQSWKMHYKMFLAVCQYRLGKKQQGFKTLMDSLSIARSVKASEPNFQVAKFIQDIELVESLLEQDLKEQQKNILNEIKQLVSALPSKPN